MKIAKTFFGIIFICLGIFFLLASMGIMGLENLLPIFKLWPLGFIIAGVVLLFTKQKTISLFIVLLSIVFAIMSIILPTISYDIEHHNKQGEIELENVDKVDLEINFGAGSIELEKGNNQSLLSYELNSTRTDDLQITKDTQNNKTRIKFSKESTYHNINLFNLNTYESNWKLNLNPENQYNLDLNYGAAEVNLDLRNLKINNLDIESGATSTKIFFENYPTSSTINTGASNYELSFPSNYSTKVIIEGGVIDVNLEGFKKSGKIYITENFNEEEHIEVIIGASASSISGGIRK